MVCFPSCKINLGLNVIRKRQDGYHDISTCFYPVPWNDILEIIPSNSTNLIISGNEVDGNLDDNLVIKAINLLRSDFTFQEIDTFLHKCIPSGAGLGGGSSDGAHMLNLLNEKFKLGISKTALKKYALKLGSDCPFFIDNQPAIATGRGEKLEIMPFTLQEKYLVILKPDVHVSTAEAYSGVNPGEPELEIKDILLNHDISEWQELLVNDFEESVFKNYPELAEIKKDLIKKGAQYAAMSGSGSSVFGIFENRIDLDLLETKYTSWSGFLS